MIDRGQEDSRIEDSIRICKPLFYSALQRFDFLAGTEHPSGVARNLRSPMPWWYLANEQNASEKIYENATVDSFYQKLLRPSSVPG